MDGRRLVAGTLCLLAAVLVTGCSEDDPEPPRRPAPVSIRALDVDTLSLVRIAFCDLVPAAAVRRAVGGAPSETDSWSNGDPVPGGRRTDVGHEFGCAWTGPRGATARAWVYARPVDRAFARALVRSRAGADLCPALTGLPFGDPSLTLSCDRPGGRRLVRHAGLFTDTWLTCEVGSAASASRVRRAADAWCVAVATSLDQG